MDFNFSYKFIKKDGEDFCEIYLNNISWIKMNQIGEERAKFLVEVLTKISNFIATSVKVECEEKYNCNGEFMLKMKDAVKKKMIEEIDKW